MIRELKHDRDSQSKLLTSKQEEQEQQPPEESESVSLPEAVTEPTTEMKTEPITEPISIKQEITSDIFLDSETSPVPATDPTATFPTVRQMPLLNINPSIHLHTRLKSQN